MSKFSVDIKDDIEITKESPNARGGKMKFEITPGIIISKLDLKENDTIIITVDMDIWDINAASEMCKMVSKIFPNNNVVTTFKGIVISAGATPSPK